MTAIAVLDKIGSLLFHMLLQLLLLLRL